ncbi:flagellar hook-associated protein FlgK, partial [Pseudomonas donghuensis]|nr:flagellar hook-associated protein FlgK [Pseudomonas donghuensis]
LQIKDQVDRINEIGDKIYALNLEIQKTESGGVETAMTARDARDSLIDELAGYAKIEAEEDSTGYVRIKLEGQQFVQDNKCNHIGLTE